MEPMTGFDKEGFQPDAEPERSEGNRPDSENCIIGGKPMSKAVEQTV